MASVINRLCAAVVTMVTVPVVYILWTAEGGHPPAAVLIPFVLLFFSAPVAAIGIVGGMFERRRGHKSWISALAFGLNVLFVATALVMLFWLLS